MYTTVFGQFKKQLKQLDLWLEKAEAYAAEKKFDGGNFATMRVAIDQLPFARQIQICCDTVKLGAARLAGKDAPKQEDTEKTLGELRARVTATLAYVETFTAKDFEGADARLVTQPRWEGKSMTGANYFIEHVVPNFYFHLNHTYALLRHAGVPLGKADYLGALTKQ
jgi:uncharacterized protein